jgi:hypothetical protein
MQPHATKDDYNRALEGIDFPASTDLVVRTARDHGGIDSEVAVMLSQLPEGSYSSRDELIEAIRGLYSAAGVDRTLIPV